MESSLCEDVNEDNFNRQCDINFKGAYFTVQKSLHLLRDKGSIIFISSILNVKGIPGTSIYAAAKAAVRSLTRTLAVELAPKEIRVHSISPGLIETPFNYRYAETKEQIAQVDEAIKKFIAPIPLQRSGNPEDIASVALFLASKDSSYITGIDIAVDGGLTQI